MAAAPNLSCNGDRDSLPCTAPTPLPPPQPQTLIPGPEVVVTPERDCAGRARSGILRRPQQGKAPGRQVRFRLGSKSDDVRMVCLGPPKPRLEAEVHLRRESKSDDSGKVNLELPKPREEAEVTLRLGPNSDDSRKVSPDPPKHSAEVAPHDTIILRREASRAAAEEGSHQPHMLGAPIPHSTLALGTEVQAVREQGFNAWQAAEELVQRSFVTRCAVEARVGEGMNIPRDQQLYQGLVSLQVAEEELLSSAVQEKLSFVRSRPGARKEPDCAGPDLSAFYDPEELFTESPFLEVEGLPPMKLQLQTRDPATTFIMYQKLRQWNS
ncbi:protein phosphatase 1 regulatory subunit 35 [Rhineura floridana]|uniref:protein phosphatase 1 regulatory subunit 35 n=1 Tax=Rhineura floridana TaxID=261503 RepID=UPI002AC82B7B|nr:protein phosphatase 1 regulatory subunit 35 [Rhineura floridana]XP_061444133.1 protein phosphatase 1 regulatory subunit 35 [Rhineura floridana]XP_061444134.1 protein phosphatase 1 regulatory subunit 35 [Rhineura floridana]XP_061444136.1 protein phosphatase 1 regulatory subunit 35 [Rhineura floridana]XP_061444137.1 protein phosphatase 1 regulatory subunit 35 [Rhineura floridana]